MHEADYNLLLNLDFQFLFRLNHLTELSVYFPIDAEGF